MTKAQNYNEIFRQKKTQEKYLLKQLAYLQLYGSELRKGYELAKEGLGTIHGFTSGEFKLHEAFFSALSKVSGLVRGDYRVAEIIRFQLEINGAFGTLAETSSPAPNLLYYRKVQQKVMAECNAELEELMAIVLSGELEMNDAQRLERLKKIHCSMEEKADFARWFCAQAQSLSQAQKNELEEYKNLRRLYEKN